MVLHTSMKIWRCFGLHHLDSGAAQWLIGISSDILLRSRIPDEQRVRRFRLSGLIPFMKAVPESSPFPPSPIAQVAAAANLASQRPRPRSEGYSSNDSTSNRTNKRTAAAATATISMEEKKDNTEELFNIVVSVDDDWIDAETVSEYVHSVSRRVFPLNSSTALYLLPERNGQHMGTVWGSTAVNLIYDLVLSGQKQ